MSVENLRYLVAPCLIVGKPVEGCYTLPFAIDPVGFVECCLLSIAITACAQSEQGKRNPNAELSLRNRSHCHLPKPAQFRKAIRKFLIGNHVSLMVISSIGSDQHIYFCHPPVAADSSYK